MAESGDQQPQVDNGSELIRRGIEGKSYTGSEIAGRLEQIRQKLRALENFQTALDLGFQDPADHLTIGDRAILSGTNETIETLRIQEAQIEGHWLDNSVEQ